MTNVVDRPRPDAQDMATAGKTGPKRLLLFGVTRLDDILAKGNVWYVRHYETYFDEVYVVYLHGHHPDPVTQGRTTLISVGGRRGSFWLDLALSPWRLLRLARRTRPTACLTADIVFSWWTASLLRLLRRAPVVLMPVCILPEIHGGGRSLSGLPIAWERILVDLSFKVASKVIMSRNSDASLTWLRAERFVGAKLQGVASTVEEFPAADLMEMLGSRSADRPTGQHPRLLYVGRLHPEKLPLGLVDMMAELRRQGIEARLVIAGEGPSMAEMQERADLLGVAEDIEWLGFVPSSELGDVYRRADIFVSTVTGTALREAGLAGLPIVAYDVDWVRALMKHEETALLAPAGDGKALALEVARALRDGSLRRKIADNFSAIARARWNKEKILAGLQETFG